MQQLLTERLCAEVPGEIVVFAIGMRINRWWKPWRWLPVLREMPPMLREQAADPSIGLLSVRPSFGFRNIGVLQHWQSAGHLHAYAHQAGGTHLAAWRRFNERIGTSGDVGIWHETYVVPARHAESVYVNMPRYGMGVAGRLFPARGARASARKRLSASRA
jgi:hypothetical protein